MPEERLGRKFIVCECPEVYDLIEGIFLDLKVECYLLDLVMNDTHSHFPISLVEYEAIYFLSDAVIDRVDELEGVLKGYGLDD